MTIIIFLFLLLFGGCVDMGAIDILPVYPDGPPPQPPVEIVTPVAIYPTFTPTPNPRAEISPTPTLDFSSTLPTLTPIGNGEPCTIIVRQPPINAPTRMPDPINSPTVGEPIDPHVAYCTTPNSPQVGQEWFIYLRAIDLGMPAYRVTFANIEGEELIVGFNPATSGLEVTSGLPSLSFISVITFNRWDIAIRLLVDAPDEIRVEGSASGEVHFGYPGPAMWSSGALEPFVLTTVEQ
jgi:hypothetical protein